jgi:integrase
VNFPKRLRYKGKGKVLATIYKRPHCYQLYWRQRDAHSKLKSWFKDFTTYSAAKKHGDTVIADLAKGKQTPLSPGQANDALAAIKRLQAYFQSTGRRVSLHSAVAAFADASEKLGSHTFDQAVDGFLRNVASVKRKLINQAVNEFIEGRKHLSESKDGARPRHNPKYERNVKSWLDGFAGSFQNTVVNELTKEHVGLYFEKFKDLSAKSRNDRRVTLKMFFSWCVSKDYLAGNHRLIEAPEFKAEDADTGEIDFYRPQELRDMLNNADADLLPVIALGGLAGLRREEILRLNWKNVWSVKGKVEIGREIAKGRKRRLVNINASLNAWLRSYRHATGQVWNKTSGELEKAYAKLRADLEIPARRNGLRHSFITFHMAAHTNENLTAAEAGNSPQMIHDHYRALATAKEAKAWFSVRKSKVSGNVIALPDRKIRA